MLLTNIARYQTLTTTPPPPTTTKAAAMKERYPSSKIALLAMTWRSSNGPREASWNDQVFGNATLLQHIDAATLHPYFGISWPASEEEHQDVAKDANDTNDAKDAAKGCHSNTYPNRSYNLDDTCGKTGVGASGPWLATASASSACECAAHCTAMSETCRAWQVRHNPTGI